MKWGHEALCLACVRLCNHKHPGCRSDLDVALHWRASTGKYVNRNDAIVLGDRHSLREAWRYRPARGIKFSAWICDETLSTFLLGKDIERPAAEDICHVKVLEEEDKSAQSLSKAPRSAKVSHAYPPA